MSNLLKYGLLGLVLMAAVMGIGLFSLTSTEISADQVAIVDVKHTADCTVCRLPMFGEGGRSSHFGAVHAH